MKTREQIELKRDMFKSLYYKCKDRLGFIQDEYNNTNLYRLSIIKSNRFTAEQYFPVSISMNLWSGAYVALENVLKLMDSQSKDFESIILKQIDKLERKCVKSEKMLESFIGDDNSQLKFVNWVSIVKNQEVGAKECLKWVLED